MCEKEEIFLSQKKKQLKVRAIALNFIVRHNFFKNNVAKTSTIECRIVSLLLWVAKNSNLNYIKP